MDCWGHRNRLPTRLLQRGRWRSALLGFLFLPLLGRLSSRAFTGPNEPEQPLQGDRLVAAAKKILGESLQLPLSGLLTLFIFMILLWELISPRFGAGMSSVLNLVPGMDRLLQRLAGEEKDRDGQRGNIAKVMDRMMHDFSQQVTPKRSKSNISASPSSQALSPSGRASSFAKGASAHFPKGTQEAEEQKQLLQSHKLDEWDEAEARSGPDDFEWSSNQCFVFFKSHTIPVRSSQKTVSVELFRVGSLAQELRVKWRTLGGTAVAGQHFQAAESEVVFPAGVGTAGVSVELLPSKYEYVERYFVVHIDVLDEHGASGSLPFARVRIVTDLEEPWPGVDIKRPTFFTRPSKKEESRRLLFAFLRMLLHRNRANNLRLMLAIFWLDFHAIILNTLLLNLLLVDFCLTKPLDDRSYLRLAFVVIACFVLLLSDRTAFTMKMRGTGAGGHTAALRQQIMFKFLEMPEDPCSTAELNRLTIDAVPDAINFGYLPLFSVLSSLLKLVLSMIVVFIVPVLKGHGLPSLPTLEPLAGLLIALPTVYVLALRWRESEMRHRVMRQQEADDIVGFAEEDLLDSRNWIRTFDGSYPTQHARRSYEDAVKQTLARTLKYKVFMNDTRWISKYVGEVAKLMIIPVVGYQMLNSARGAPTTITLGQFTLVMSLYGAVIGAMNDIIEAVAGWQYAAIVIQQLADFMNKPNPRAKHEDAEQGGQPSLPGKGHFNITINRLEMNYHQETSTIAGALIPLGKFYAIRTGCGWPTRRLRLASVLGGEPQQKPESCEVVAPRFLRRLLVSPPAKFSRSSVLDNLMIMSAAWVRACDVVALLSVLCIPMKAPPGAEVRHTLSGSRLVDALAKALKKLEKGGEDKTTGIQRFGTLGALTPHSPSKGWSSMLHGLVDASFFEEVAASFTHRMDASEIDVLSPMDDVEPLLRPPELQLLDLARAMIADPDVLVVQDILVGLPPRITNIMLTVLEAWQKLGGLKGVVSVWEQAREQSGSMIGGPSEGSTESNEFPEWLTSFGTIRRTVVLSESSLVFSSLRIDAVSDYWLEVGDSGTGLDIIPCKGKPDAAGQSPSK